MPQATRLDDVSSGHDNCPPVPLISASENVFINKNGAGRLGDPYAVHGCPIHAPHQDEIAEGSTTIFINGLPAGRVDDAVTIGGSVAIGSENVIIGG